MKSNHILLTLFCSFVTFFTAFGMEQNENHQIEISSKDFEKRIKKLSTNSGLETHTNKIQLLPDVYSSLKSEYTKKLDLLRKQKQLEQKQLKQKQNQKKQKQKKQQKQTEQNLLLETFINKANDEKEKQEELLKELIKEKKEKEKKLNEYNNKLLKMVNNKNIKIEYTCVRTKKRDGTVVVHAGVVACPSSPEIIFNTHIAEWIKRHEDVGCPGNGMTNEQFDQSHSAQKESIEGTEKCCPYKFIKKVNLYYNNIIIAKTVNH